VFAGAKTPIIVRTSSMFIALASTTMYAVLYVRCDMLVFSHDLTQASRAGRQRYSRLRLEAVHVALHRVRHVHPALSSV
jgi:hypothetical protein